MSFLKSSPGPTNLPDVLQMYPRRAIPMLRLIDDILRGDSPFTTAEREMIFAFASSQNQCSFCYESHKPVAGAFGIDETVFDELLADIDAASVREELKPVLKYVRKLTLTPYKMIAADAEAIYGAGWDDQALVDAASICAIANYYNRFVDGVGIDVSSAVARETGGAILPTIGYAGLADTLEKGQENQ